MGYRPEGDQAEVGARLMREYDIAGERRLTSCSTCHR
jgi:hypothetical protein